MVKGVYKNVGSNSKNRMMKREYVIFWSTWDLYRQSYADIIALDNVQYIERPLSRLGGVYRRLYDFVHYEHSGFVKKMLHKIAKSIFTEDYWMYFYFDEKKIKKNNGVFIFSGWWHLCYVKYFLYLKKKYPNARYVLFFSDLFDNIKNDAIKLDIEFIKQNFDLILSFDQDDCKRYGFIYHPLVFSQYRGIIEDLPMYDIYFLGQPKNRFKELISCFEKFWKYGLKTDICLVGVKPEEQVYKEKIQYSDEFISYKENLQRTLHAKCELEIMQKGGAGYTQRMCEVIALDKKIVTNNPLIHEAPFYNPDYIFQIRSTDDITEELCDKIKAEKVVDYHYKEKLSPVELLEFIDARV